MTQGMFEQLRFTAAQTLRMMQVYEKKPILQLISDLEKGKLKEKEKK